MPIFNRIAPARGRIVVEPFETPKMRGGLYIPDTAVNEARSSQIGTVIWVSRDYEVDPLDEDFDDEAVIEGTRYKSLSRYKVGDIVLFGKWSGAEIELEGRTVYCLTEDSIMGTLHADPEEVSSDNPG